MVFWLWSGLVTHSHCSSIRDQLNDYENLSVLQFIHTVFLSHNDLHPLTIKPREGK